jgi:hypothetical protein
MESLPNTWRRESSIQHTNTLMPTEGKSMKRVLRNRLGLIAAAGLALGGTAFAAAPIAASAATNQGTSKTVLAANKQNEKQVKKLLGNKNYTPVIRTYTPKPTSTKGFTGYETIVVGAPKGTTPVVGYFTLKGEQPSSVVVTAANVQLKRSAYVVKLKFPGEQGKTGKLKVTLISR